MEVIALILAFILGWDSDLDLQTAEWGLTVIGWMMLMVIAVLIIIWKGQD